MNRAGIPVNESIDCTSIGAGVASERMLAITAAQYRAVNVGANRIQFARSYRPLLTIIAGWLVPVAMLVGAYLLLSGPGDEWYQDFGAKWAVWIGVILPAVIVGVVLQLIRRGENWSATIEEDYRQVAVRVEGRILPVVLIDLRDGLAAGPEAVIRPEVGVAALPVNAPASMVVGVPTSAPVPGGGAALAAPPLIDGAPSLPPPPPGSAALPPPPPAAAPAPAAPVLPPPPPAAPVPTPIGPPPGVVPSSPPAPAAPPPSAPPPMAPPTPAVAEEPAEEELASDTTNLLPADAVARAQEEAAPAALVLEFDTGERHAADGLVLVGRDPSPDESDAEPTLVPIEDPGRSVSKTHVAVRRADGGGLWVLDRGSTNGTVVEAPDGRRTDLEPRRAHRVDVGTRVHFGARSFVVVEGDA